MGWPRPPRLREKWGAPVGGASHPPASFERQAPQGIKLGPPVSYWQRSESNLRRDLWLGTWGTRGEYNAHGLLHSLEDPCVNVWPVPVRGAVNHPYLVGGAPQIVTHPLKAPPVEQ